MQRPIASILRIAIPALLAVLLLYFAFRNVDFAEFISKSKATNYWWVILSIVLSLFSYIVRAWRWNLLLLPMGFEVTTFRTTLSVLIGYLANLAFPRLGEVTRCAVLKKTDDVPMTISVGSVISERIIDALTLLGLIGFSFILEFDLISGFIGGLIKSVDLPIRKIALWGGGAIVLGAIAFFVFASRQLRLLVRLRTLLRGLYQGILSAGKIEKFRYFIASTVVLWVLYYFMGYVVFFSLPETAGLSVSAGFMLLVMGGIALALPVQGGIGTYHAIVSALLLLYGIDQTTGLFLATLLHTSQIVAVALFGGIAALISVFITRTKNNGSYTSKNRNMERPGGKDEEVEK